MILVTPCRIMLKHMRQVLGSFKSCSSERSLSMSRPPTIPTIELFSSSRTKSSNKPIKTGSQPYFGGMMKLVKSALMARPCAESRSLALTPSHTSHRPITLILSRCSLWMQCPSRATSWSPSVGSWMSWMCTPGRTWSKRAGEAAKNMELLTKIDLFILQRLKAKLDKSIQRVQMLLAKLTPMQLFDLEL